MPEDGRRRPGRGFGVGLPHDEWRRNGSRRRAPAEAGGAWFGPIRCPVLRRTYAVVRDW